jgi:hypothetical protein
MKSELGLLTQDQKESLSALLRGSDKYVVPDLDKTSPGEIKSFVLAKDRLLKTYTFLMKNTSKDNLKYQIQDLLTNTSLSPHNMIMVCFMGPEHNRTTVFSDVNFQVLFGLMSKYDYS